MKNVISNYLILRGNIEVVEFIGKNIILTAGRDNHIKFWLYDEIDDIEPEEHLISEISPLKSIYLYEDAHILSINTDFFEKEHFIFIKTSDGKILKLIFMDFKILINQEMNSKQNYTKIIQGKINSKIVIQI